MEDRWHGPEDPTNEDLETTRKKRRGTDFLSQYLLRRKDQQGEQIEEDDDEESEEKPKKFRRFFKGLFKRVVEPPAGGKEEAPKTFSLESLFLGRQEEQAAEPEEQVSVLESQEQPSLYATPEVNTPEVSDDVIATSSEHSRPAEEAASIAPEAREAAEQQPDQPELPEIETEHSFTEPNVVERAIPDDRTVFERAVPQPAIEKEVVIERGTGMALPVVLVGAEYLARKKADRKLDAKYDDRVGKIETENKRDQIAKEQLTTLVEQNREQLETLKRYRGIETARPEKRQPVEKVMSRPEKQPTPEQKPQSPVERVPQPTTPEKIEKPETYKIMEQVAEAAERDVPVERVFERSHEVKDDQSVPVGAASIGAIMADQLARQQGGVQGRVKSQNQDIGSLPVVSDQVQTAMYKQAMQRGFWAAIIIIIIGILAYLLK